MLIRYTGSCHCGSVQFEVDTDVTQSVVCDCSICKRRGAIMLRCNKQSLQITAGEEHLTLYRFNTMAAEHYFCKICGIYTFHKMRKMPDKYAINSGCLDDVDIAKLQRVFNKGSER